jgi:carboxysome shell carbonic anhydrase
MLSTRRKQSRSLSWSKPSARSTRPAKRSTRAKSVVATGQHPLTNGLENQRLHDYEQSVKEAFDVIVPTLKKVSSFQNETDFEARAQQIALEQLGYRLPESFLEDAWVEQLDMRRLFAWCVFETYQRFCDDFFNNDPLASGNDSNFKSMLQECGFHTLDVSPCADGRLAHVIRYVMRLPYREVRRKSYAGAMFDIEDSIDKWVETELLRFREGQPNTADLATRYLKTVIYHYSSVDPSHEGCAAHGSDTDVAAEAGMERLHSFKKAIENTYCCGASIDHLLIGLDTDTDTIRIHVPDENGSISLDKYIGANDIYEMTLTMSAEVAKKAVVDLLESENPGMPEGMAKFITYLLINNISQIDYVRNYHGEYYQDAGHAERFIGAGIGFEEVQLRNLTYFAYLNTVEEAAADLDVGIKIFSGLNVSHGLPVPIVVRYDYHGNVPGARERAVQHCHRVADALNSRYSELTSQGLLHTLLAVRDVNASGCIEVLGSSVKALTAQEAH